MEVLEVLEEVVVTSDGEWCLADTGLAAAELLPPPGLRPRCLPASKYKRYSEHTGPHVPHHNNIWEATGPHCSLGKNILKYPLPFILAEGQS